VLEAVLLLVLHDRCRVDSFLYICYNWVLSLLAIMYSYHQFTLLHDLEATVSTVVGSGESACRAIARQEQDPVSSLQAGL